MYVLENDPAELASYIRDEIMFPGVIENGKRGHAAKRVQEWLCLHGLGLVIDSDYGGVTEEVVKRFQFDNGLDVTGAVDEATWTALVQPMVNTLINPIVASSSMGEGMVAFAQQHLNEHPREVGGANAGPWVRLYMNGNDGPAMLWCAGFCRFMMRQVGEAMMHPLQIKGSASCDTFAAQAKDAGIFLAERDATPDAITPGSIFLRRSDPLDWTHVGIVTEAGAAAYTTIEGNTNDDGVREGYEVCARSRGYSNYDFIIL